MSPEDQEFADYYNACTDEFRDGMLAAYDLRPKLAIRCMQVAVTTYAQRLSEFSADCMATASVLALIQEAYGSVHIVSLYDAAGLCADADKDLVGRNIVLQFNLLYTLGIIESADPVTCLLKLNFSKFPKTAGLTKYIGPMHGIDFTLKVAKSRPEDINAEFTDDDRATYRLGLTNILNTLAKFDQEEPSDVGRR